MSGLFRFSVFRKRKVCCKNSHKLTRCNSVDVTGAPKLTLADVTVARTCTMPEKVQLCGREWCPKTDPPAPCASNPEARLKYLKYPSLSSRTASDRIQVADCGLGLGLTCSDSETPAGRSFAAAMTCRAGQPASWIGFDMSTCLGLSRVSYPAPSPPALSERRFKWRMPRTACVCARVLRAFCPRHARGSIERA